MPDPNEIGVLYEKTSKSGTRFMSGTINGQRVVVFSNTKKTKETQPDWRVLISRASAKPDA